MDDSRQAVVRVICGPTAAGKTSVAVWLASHADLTVISADSRQLYRGFDIGTAKPRVREQRAVPHAGIDVLDPGQRPSAAWWAERAEEWLDEAVLMGRTPLVVGGTGLYLRALFGDFFEAPPMRLEDRQAVEIALAELSTDELRRWVGALDPARAHLGRVQLLRAIEIALLTGRRVSDLHRDNARAPRRRARYLLVDPGTELAARIVARVETMLANGWPEEVQRLMRSVPDDAPAWNASGYGTIRELVQGRIDMATARERVVIETRQYAKRQRTWFRHQLAGEDVTRVSGGPDCETTLLSWWKGDDA